MSLAAAMIVAALAASPTALDRLADQVVADVQRSGAAPPVAIAVQGPREAAQAFGTLVAAKLSAARLAGVVASDETAARAAGAASLVRLELSVQSSEISARGDLHGLWRSFWAGKTPVQPAGPAQVVVEHVPADATALALFGQTPAAPTATPPHALVARVLATIDGRPAAVIAGDLNGDSIDEVIVLTDRAVIALDAHGAELARESLDALDPSRTPSRDPFGALALVGNPVRVAAFSASRAQGQLLAFDASQRALVETERIDLPLLGRGGLTFAARFVPGENRFAPASLPSSLGSLHAAFQSVSFFAGPKGTEALALEPDGAGVRLHGGKGTALRALGAASTLVDLDGDGSAELITTMTDRTPAPDAASVVGSTWPAVPISGRAVAATSAHFGPDARQSAVIAAELPDGRTQLFVVEAQ